MAEASSRSRVSAGTLRFHRTGGGIEVPLGHTGGPNFQDRDVGARSSPKVELRDFLLARLDA